MPFGMTLVSPALSIKYSKTDAWDLAYNSLLPQAVLQRSYGNIKLSISKVVLRKITFLLEIGAIKYSGLKQGMLGSGH